MKKILLLSLSPIKFFIVAMFICLLSLNIAMSNEQYEFYNKWENDFNSPMGIAIGPNGNVYIADTSNNRIQKFSPEGDFITKWGKNFGDGSIGNGNGEFRHPRCITVTSDSYVFVGDSENYRIQKFTLDGNFIDSWETEWAYDIAVDNDGNIYIPKPNINGYIFKLDQNGNKIKEWGIACSSNGLAIDKIGNIFVACQNTNVIQKYTLNGDFLLEWKNLGDESNLMSNPRGIEIDNDGDAFVVDSGNNRIVKFSSNGSYICKWGEYGSGDGQFNLPFGIAVSNTGLIFVADAYNNRIQIFKKKVVNSIEGKVITSSEILGYTACVGGAHITASFESQELTAISNIFGEYTIIISDAYNGLINCQVTSQYFESITKSFTINEGKNIIPPIEMYKPKCVNLYTQEQVNNLLANKEEELNSVISEKQQIISENNQTIAELTNSISTMYTEGYLQQAISDAEKRGELKYDLNNDGQVGIEEVIKYLEIISGVRVESLIIFPEN